MTAFPSDDEFDIPPDEEGSSESAALPAFSLGDDDPELAAAEARAGEVRHKHERALLEIDGVEGITTEAGPIGDLQIVVFVRDLSVAKNLPKTLDGIPVEVEVAEFDAFAPGDLGGGGGAEPAAKKKASAKRKASARKTSAKKTSAKGKPAAKKKATATKSGQKAKAGKRPKARKKRSE